MKCPKCKKKIHYLEFVVDPEDSPGTGHVRVDKDGNLYDEPDFDPMDLTGPDPDPAFYCPTCNKDISEYIKNAEGFWDLC